MNLIDSKWEIITPMFLHGYDNRRDLELRAPPIKSLMRYWWRALHGNLSTEDLYEEESKIFGAADESIGKSKFSLRILANSDYKIKRYKLLQQHKNFMPKALAPESIFNIRLQSYCDFDYLKKCMDLLYLSLILGGLGQRARRGFGSVKKIEILTNKSEIDFIFNKENNLIVSLFEMMNKLTTNVNYICEENEHRINIDDTSAYNLNIPYIKQIKIGRSFNYGQQILEKIDQMCHNLSRTMGNNYRPMGFSDNRNNIQMASSLYISIIEINDKFNPIMTKLNPVFPKNGITPPQDLDQVPNKFIAMLS